MIGESYLPASIFGMKFLLTSSYRLHYCLNIVLYRTCLLITDFTKDYVGNDLWHRNTYASVNIYHKQ